MLSGKNVKDSRTYKNMQRLLKSKVRNKLQVDGGNPRDLFEELRQELKTS